MPARKPALRSFSRRRRAGFSLLEMAIVLAIMGALLSGGLLAGASMIERGQYSATRDALDQAAQALNDFSITARRLPCVAPLNALPNTTTFGTEIAAGGCISTTPSGLTTNGTLRADDGSRIVRIGALPTRTLGLPDSAGADGFGNRILYVVTESLTAPNSLTAPATKGAIAVMDGSGNVIVNDSAFVGGAAFFLASAGADRKGGFGFKTGSAAIPCTGTNLDVENCNLSPPDITFRDALFNDGTEAARFDDLTRWATKTSLGVVTSGGGSNLWGNSGDTIFSVGSDNNTTTGNVGIGTTTPSQNLHVTTPDLGGGNQTAMQIGTGVGSLFLSHNWATISSNLRYDDNQFRYEAAGSGAVINMSPAGDIRFHSAASGAAGAVATPTERMRITNTGNVGIGTTAPVNRLTVAGDGTAIAQLGTSSCPGDYAALTLGLISAPTGCTNYNILSSPTDTNLYINRPYTTGPTGNIHFRMNNVDQMIITNAGRVGIGYTAPVATLDVNGSIASDQYTIPSDARLKYNIHPIFTGEGLKILAGLQPVSFQWKKNDRADIGLIAQEVEKHLPQAVEKTDDGMLRVTYDKIILPVITAIQDLHEIVKKLASQITAMAERQSALENRLTALEAENAALREEVNTLKMEKQN